MTSEYLLVPLTKDQDMHYLHATKTSTDIVGKGIAQMASKLAQRGLGWNEYVFVGRK